MTNQKKTNEEEDPELGGIVTDVTDVLPSTRRHTPSALISGVHYDRWEEEARYERAVRQGQAPTPPSSPQAAQKPR